MAYRFSNQSQGCSGSRCSGHGESDRKVHYMRASTFLDEVISIEDTLLPETSKEIFFLAFRNGKGVLFMTLELCRTRLPNSTFPDRRAMLCRLCAIATNYLSYHQMQTKSLNCFLFFLFFLSFFPLTFILDTSSVRRPYSSNIEALSTVS